MMVIINIMKPTGVFEYIAIKSAKMAKGKPFMIMAIFSVVTAVVSAFLDNVTTVLLIAPVTLLICQALELDVVPFLITEALASNIGGTATLIGDPPNIMIASKAQLGFHVLCLSSDAGHYRCTDRITSSVSSSSSAGSLTVKEELRLTGHGHG